MVGHLERLEVVLRHGIIHVCHVAILRRDGTGLRDWPEGFDVHLPDRSEVPRLAVSDDVFQRNRIGERGCVWIDREDSLHQPSEPRNHRCDLGLGLIDQVQRPDDLLVEIPNVR